MEEKFEIICDECSKTFESTDEAATLCPECWKTLISEMGDGVDGVDGVDGGNS